MAGLIRNSGLYTGAAGGGAVTQPTVVRAAQIGTMTGGLTGSVWNTSGTFDASGTEPNRVLIIFALIFDNGGSGAMTVTSLTIGGTAATLGKAPIAGDTTRGYNTAGYYRIAPTNSASLAVAWNLAGAVATTAGKIYGVLVRDAHQTTPLSNNGQVNTGVNDLFVDVTLTASISSSLILGGFLSRGADTTHSSRNGSTIVLGGTAAQQTGTSPTLDIDTSIASIPGGAAGSKTLGVTLASSDGRGGLAFAVRPV